jgi:hypothetical protein
MNLARVYSEFQPSERERKAEESKHSFFLFVALEPIGGRKRSFKTISIALKEYDDCCSQIPFSPKGFF